ncbi:MAG: hypothetical protein KAS30_01720 [Candidatus Diapherotrites archaeon]|nr:hypothetical protein [Candidatus Diapherotrites archaeon]
MPKLTFDEKDHKYFVDGVVYPSVTQVIKPLTDFDSIPAQILKKKAKWGSQIDTMIEYDIEGCLDYNSLNDSQKRVLAQFAGFCDAEGLDFDSSTCITKFRGFHPRLKYAGESDLIFPGNAIIDVKTRKLNKLTDPLQLSGYNGIYTKEALDHFILSLYEDKYEFKQVNKKASERKQSWSRFRYLLDKVWADIDFKHKTETWKEQK